MSKDLFLSYNSRDRAAVDTVRQLLKLRNVEAFFDCIDLTPGRPWFDELEVALKEVRGVAVFFGPSGLGLVQKRELWVALSRQVEEERAKRSFPVVPVMLPGSRPEDLPAFCALNTWLDLRKGGIEAEDQLDRLVRSLSPDSGGSVDILPAARPSICPYRALEVFREEDALLFFGREPLSRSILEKVLACPLVAVVGASGSGKSSLAQAGLIPLLRQQRPPADVWEVIIAKPQAEPYYEIAVQLAALLLAPDHTRADRVAVARKIEAALRAKETKLSDYLKQALEALRPTGTTRLLIILDQFEQIFTHGLSPPERSDLIESLLEAIAGPTPAAKLLITLRADFVQPGLCLGADFVERYQDGIRFVGPMRDTELREAIEGPALRVGLGFEPGLVETILQDLGKEPGELALLEFTMTELWHRRRFAKIGINEELTLDAYLQIGRIHGAIANRADGLLPPNSKQLEKIERALLRLVHVSPAGAGSGDARHTARKSEFSEDEWALLSLLVDARLLVTDSEETGAFIQVAHEALIRHWNWLRERIGKKRTFLLWRQRLQMYLDDWKKHGTSAPLPRPLHSEATEMLVRFESDLNDIESSFIKFSLRSAKKKRRRLMASIGSAALLLIAFTCYFLWTQTNSYAVSQGVRLHGTVVSRGFASTAGFEVLAMVDRKEAWNQIRLIPRDRDATYALAGMLSATQKTSPSSSLETAFSRLKNELKEIYPKHFVELSLATIGHFAREDGRSCELFEGAFEETKRLGQFPNGKIFRARSVLSALQACRNYSQAEELSQGETGPPYTRLLACLKTHNETCVSDFMEHFMAEDAVKDPQTAVLSLFSSFSEEAWQSEAFKTAAKNSKLGAILYKLAFSPSQSKFNSDSLEAFAALRSSGFGPNLDRSSGSLLKSGLETELINTLNGCTIARGKEPIFIQLSLVLRRKATDLLANCVMSFEGSESPLLATISKSRTLLTLVSRELRSRGETTQATRVAWLAVASDEASYQLGPPRIEGPTAIPTIGELFPLPHLEVGDSLKIADEIVLSAASSPARDRFYVGLVQWSSTIPSISEAKAVAEKPISRLDPLSPPGLLDLIGAASSWRERDKVFSDRLVNIVEQKLGFIPEEYQNETYSRLIAFYCQSHQYVKALELAKELPFDYHKGAAVIQILRAHWKEINPGAPGPWPAPDDDVIF